MRINRIYLIIAVGLLLRSIISFWNGVWGPSIGAENDAIMFHNAAVEYSKNLEFDGFTIGHIYSYFLGIFYSFTSPSLLFGSLLSSAVWAISAIFLVKLLLLFKTSKKDQFLAILIFSLLPSSIMFTSITLRESYQLFFVTLTIYSALKVYLNRSSTHWIFLLFGTAGMSVLHGALLAFSVFIFVYVLLLISHRIKKNILLRALVFIPATLAIVAIGYFLFSNISYNIEDGLSTAVQNFQEGSLNQEGRAFYRDAVSISGPFGLILFIPTALFQYLFEPLPWRISSTHDLVKILENIIRLWLIILAINNYRTASKNWKFALGFMILSYIFIELVWAIGTTNWGTAARHHIPSFGLLIAAALSGNRNRTDLKIIKTNLMNNT